MQTNPLLDFNPAHLSCLDARCTSARLSWQQGRSEPSLGKRRRAPSVSTRCGTVSSRSRGAVSEEVEVTIQSAADNARCLFAGVSIRAPSDRVWNALTDYDQLGTFIPGLAVNQCLTRQHRKARLLQIGEQRLALGARFRAKLILDIEEHPDGVSQTFFTQAGPAGPSGSWYPCPVSLGQPTRLRDISFKMHEGDFQAFQGVWRIEDDSPEETRLSYSLFVRPQPWLPVGLIQGTVKGGVQANLQAVRRHSEQMAQRKS